MPSGGDPVIDGYASDADSSGSGSMLFGHCAMAPQGRAGSPAQKSGEPFRADAREMTADPLVGSKLETRPWFGDYSSLSAR